MSSSVVCHYTEAAVDHGLCHMRVETSKGEIMPSGSCILGTLLWLARTRVFQ